MVMLIMCQPITCAYVQREDLGFWESAQENRQNSAKSSPKMDTMHGKSYDLVNESRGFFDNTLF